MTERTLVVLKPDAVGRGLVGRIVARFEDVGLKVVGMRMTVIDDELARKHYSDLEERIGTPAFEAVCRYMQSGPVVAMAIEGCDGTVAVVRKLVGATFPSDAVPGTIRGDLCHQGRRPAGASEAVYNLIHASGSVEEASQELALWFDDAEVFAYTRGDEALTQ